MHTVQTGNLYTDIYAAAALELGYEVDVILSSRPLIVIKHLDKELKVYWNYLAMNSVVDYKLAENKSVTYDLLSISKQKIRIPKHSKFVFKDFDTIKNMAASIHKYSVGLNNCVIKPLKGSCGKGVFIKPKSLDDIVLSLESIQSLSIGSAVIVEEFFEGADYRLITYRGELIDIVERTPANVVGDGIQTISALIEQKNKYREDLGMKPIKVDSSVLDILNSQGLELASIPEKGQRIMLRMVCNLAQGGDVSVVDMSHLPLWVYDLCRNIFTVTGITFLGIDLMAQNLFATDDQAGYIVNEINSSPMPDVNYFARTKMENRLDPAKNLLQAYFSH